MDGPFTRRRVLGAFGAGAAAMPLVLPHLVVEEYDPAEPAVWNHPRADPGNTAALSDVAPGAPTTVAWEQVVRSPPKNGMVKIRETLFISTSCRVVALGMADGDHQWTDDANRSGVRNNVCFLPIFSSSPNTVPRVAGNRCFVASSGGISINARPKVAALDTTTGKEAWHYELSRDPTDLHLLGNTLFVADEWSVLALDRTSGVKRWRSSDLGRLVAADGNRLLAVDEFGDKLIALDPETGDRQWVNELAAYRDGTETRQWQTRVGERTLDGDLVWPGETWANTVLKDGAIYTSIDGTLLALDASTGRLQWFREPDVEEGTVGQIAVDEQVYVLRPRTGRVVCVTGSGDRRWDRTLPGLESDREDRRGGLAVADGAVYVATEAGLWTLDPMDGSTLASVERELSHGLIPLLLAEEGVYVLSGNTVYRFVDEERQSEVDT